MVNERGKEREVKIHHDCEEKHENMSMTIRSTYPTYRQKAENDKYIK